MKNNIKSLLIIGLVSVLAGCKIAVMVPSGGDITSASGTRNCVGGSLCEHNITDSTFNESFTAVARPGYVFTKWNSGSGFLCANSTNPTCVISNVGTAGNAVIEAVIATGQFFYAMPLFEFVGIDTDGDGQKDHVDADDDNDGLLDADDSCPLDGPNLDSFGCPSASADYVVSVFGRTWYQVDLFVNLSVNDIRQVCNPVCANGTLNGHPMAGWIFASRDEVAELVSLVQAEVGLEWAPYMFDVIGFRRLTVPAYVDRGIFGWTNSTFFDGVGKEFGYSADIWDSTAGEDTFSKTGVNQTTTRQSSRGAWFYRSQ